MKILPEKMCAALLLLTPLWAQAETRYFVETDPIAFAIKGYSLHGGIEKDGLRFEVGAYGAEYPDAFSDNTNFKVKEAGYGFNLDYYGSSNKGGFVGVGYNQTRLSYQLTAANITESRSSNMAGIRVGYKYIARSGWYVMPWMSVSKRISDLSPVNISGETYVVREYMFFPTVHVGMQF